MQVYIQDPEQGCKDLDHLRLENTAVALGGFDAMHLGHRSLIETMVHQAKACGLTSVVYLFINVPRGVLQNTPVPVINSLEKRLELLRSWGVDVVVAERFTSIYGQMTCDEFVSNYLIKRFDVRYVAVGFDYCFGRGGEGDRETLCRAGERFGFHVYVQECVHVNNKPVSSTYIRKLLADGQVQQTKEYLGRFFSVEGVVVEGNQQGRIFGFPTANLPMPENRLLPMLGVYAGYTKTEFGTFVSITNVGEKPTVKNSYPCIESHLIDFEGNLYGRPIEVEFCRFLRPISKFESIAQLKQQLKQDRDRARTELGN